MTSTTLKSDRAAWLKGADCACNIPAKVRRHTHRLVLLGAPGVGKGTQAQLLSEKLGACHLSTGDIFRAAKSAGAAEASPAMKVALECMRRGDLVSDETVLSLVIERASCLHCGGGFLLDGFPRTLAQAEALDRLLIEQKAPLEAVISYDLPLNVIVGRLSGRRTCSKCKAVFHTQTLPSKVEGVCDHCGGSLLQREDDQPEAVRERMAVYERSTVPLTEFYSRKGLLISVAADGAPEEVLARTLHEMSDW
jgi:adenylate kinase